MSVTTVWMLTAALDGLPLKAGCPEADFGPLPFPTYTGVAWSPAGNVVTYAEDFNRDNHLDVLAIGTTKAVWFQGNGDGTFQNGVTATTQSIAIAAVGDLNKDGNPDLVIAAGSATSGGNIKVLLGNGAGGFGAVQNYLATGSTSSSAYHIAVGDINGDGNPDVVTGNANPLSVAVLLGNGDGTLQSAITKPVYFGHGTLAVADFDRDGKDDVAYGGRLGDLAAGAPAFGVLHSNGDGTLSGPTLTASGALLTAGGIWRAADLDQNGAADLITISVGKIMIGFSGGSGIFTNVVTLDSPSSLYDVCPGDYDGDGIVDLAAASSTATYILAGNGDGSFVSPLAFSQGLGLARLAAADFNKDGRIDIVDAAPGNTGSTLIFLPNRTPEIPTEPVLEIIRNGEDNLVRWYDSYPGYILESSPELGSTANWTEINSGLELDRCRLVYRSTLPPSSNGGRYFRLVKPN